MSKFRRREMCTQGMAWKQSQAVLRTSDEQMAVMLLFVMLQIV